MSESKYFLNERYIFDPNERSLLDKENNDKVSWLGNNESNILLSFIQRPKQVLSRDKIHELVWTSNGFHVDESSVIQAISTVRKLLNDSAKEPTFIKTIPKHGYQFIAHSNVVDEENKSETAENTSAKKTIPDVQVEKKSGANESSKSARFMMNVLAPIVIVLFGLIWMLITIGPKSTELYEIERIDNVPIVSLNDSFDGYFSEPSIRVCIQKYLNKVEDPQEIEKIFAVFTTKEDLVINIVRRNPNKSKTYQIVAGKDAISNICLERL